MGTDHAAGRGDRQGHRRRAGVAAAGGRPGARASDDSDTDGRLAALRHRATCAGRRATSATPNSAALRTPATGNTVAAAPPPEEPRQADPSTGAADGFVIAGSVNNGASTPFALTQRFGNAVLQGRPRYFTTLTFSGNSSVLNATPYTIASVRNKPDYSSLNVTGNVQGPLRIPGLIRNGPTFQASFSRTASDNASSLFGRMPTAQERAGNFADSATPIVDPLTGRAVSGQRDSGRSHQPAGGGAARLLSAAECRSSGKRQLSGTQCRREPRLQHDVFDRPVDQFA